MTRTLESVPLQLCHKTQMRKDYAQKKPWERTVRLDINSRPKLIRWFCTEQNQYSWIVSVWEELLKKYNSIYQRLKDSSKVDILYIRERKKKTNDFNLIFSEIMKIREKLNLPLKRTIDVYYNERYNNIFLSWFVFLFLFLFFLKKETHSPKLL